RRSGRRSWTSVSLPVRSVHQVWDTCGAGVRRPVVKRSGGDPSGARRPVTNVSTPAGGGQETRAERVDTQMTRSFRGAHRTRPGSAHTRLGTGLAKGVRIYPESAGAG